MNKILIVGMIPILASTVYYLPVLTDLAKDPKLLFLLGLMILAVFIFLLAKNIKS